ncbi:MAG: nitroreductase/quinone reductase family protein [Acidimicrobiales bacterium]|nr:nitroreductase/quinone reductase family protein [Acidimicrobiales bacterium]
MVDLDARPPATPFSERTGLLGVRVMEAINVSLFEVSKGRVGGTIWGSPVVLLRVSGRRSGIRRTKPLLALPDGDAWILVGSRGGTTEHPDWYRNLLAYEAQETQGVISTYDGQPLAAPVVTWAGDHHAPVRAEVLHGEERERWWARLVAVYPKFASYQQRASDRLIPVVRVTPVH